MQANRSLEKYLGTVKSSLQCALCLRNFPSQSVEKHNKPEVEVRGNRELLLSPLTVSKSELETCLVESSINSVRVSIKIKKAFSTMPV